jgi:hypothetical protein
LNEQNLIPTNKRSKKEARELGAKGGKRSGEVRKQKAELKKLFMQYAQMRPTDKDKKKLIEMGYEENELTNLTSYVVDLFKNGRKGNPKALELSYDILIENNKKELELEKAKQEIERLKLEQEKLKRDLGNGSESFEDLTPLADLIRRKEK